MALLQLESFDTYATGKYAGKWASQTGTIGATGREGTNGLQHTSGSNLVLGVDNKQTLITGIAVKVDQPRAYSIIQYRDGGTVQCGLNTDGTNQLVVYRGSILIASTGYILNSDTWYYIEFKSKIAPAGSGTWEVHVNGVEIASDSSVQTTQTGSSYATNVYISMFRFGTATHVLDDIYIFDDTGSFCNDFVGDVHVDFALPNSVGYITQWVGVPGAGDNYEDVNEASPDDDTSFVVTSGVGYIDSYGFANLVSASGSVYGVQVNAWARKDDIGDRQLNATVRPTSTTYSGGAGLAVGSSYEYKTFQFSFNPETSDFWTIAQINAAEFGIKEEA